MNSYFEYTKKARHDKAINTLLGMLEGIGADKSINQKEAQLLNQWILDNGAFADRHPYNEFIPRVVKAMEDKILSDSEHKDLVWFCKQFVSKKYYDQITADLQQLNAVVSAIAVDGVITETEAESLLEWIGEHEHLRKSYPYDEIESVVMSAMKDRKIDQTEQIKLLELFSSFSMSDLDIQSETSSGKTLEGICAVAPNIEFEEHRFCITGESAVLPRAEIEIAIKDRGGIVLRDVTSRLHYLIVGANSNPCWSYACYGRKIETTMNLRRKGAKIIIVHERDFMDEIA